MKSKNMDNKRREFEIVISTNTKTKAEAVKMIKKAGFGVVSIKCLEERRTSQQNRALHLYFTLLARALNEAGCDMKKVIRPDIDIQWSAYSIKEYLWRPLQKVFIGEQSTTKLKTKDIDKIYDMLNKTIAERTGVSVPFPSIEDLLHNFEDCRF